MTKKIFAILMTAVLFSLSLVSVCATYDAELPRVIDDADLLTDREELLLEEAIEKIIKNQSFDVVLHTTTETDGKELNDYSNDIYDSNGYGVGEEADGIIFVLDIANREYFTSTCGRGIDALPDEFFNDETRSVNAVVRPYLAKGNTYAGFEAFLGILSADIQFYDTYGYSYYEAAMTGEEGTTETGRFTASAYVVDDADLLTDSEEAELSAKLLELRDEFKFDLALHTTNSIGSKTIAEYADDYYDYRGYGYGENYDGMIFVLNMNNGEEGNRDFYTSTHGKGIAAFPDEAIFDSSSDINSKVLPYLRDGDYYGAFERYLECVREDLKFYEENGRNRYQEVPIDWDSMHPILRFYHLTAGQLIARQVIIILASALISYLVIKRLKSKLNTAVSPSTARGYMVDNSFSITRQSDIFMGSNVTKTPINTDSGSSGRGSGSSSTHVSSSGGTHGGGGGKF